MKDGQKKLSPEQLRRLERALRAKKLLRILKESRKPSEENLPPQR